MQWTGIILRTEVAVAADVNGRASHTGESHWHEEVAANSSVGHTGSGDNSASQSANGNNPTDFMGPV